MERAEFDEYSERLAAWAAEADGVLGLVLVGSTAATAHAPDGWSDHDFFVVAEPRSAEPLRARTDWLPRRGAGIALHERDTAHGAWVVFDDGHLLEYAVFAPDEVGLSRSGALRVAVDRAGGLAERMAPTLAPPTRDPRTLATSLHRALLVGAGRGARGERLVARRHLLDAAGALLGLVAALRGADDAQDPWRRVERTEPELAAALDGILARGDAGAALALADLAAEVAGAEPWWPSALAAAVRPRLVTAGRGARPRG
ncbi:hypothetical protein LG314_11740 [Agrococcus terreus]|uniref:hypothetical protein n=1 Tax=Agrococcus terreus TaxID=574649 RepID=UPI003850320A